MKHAEGRKSACKRAGLEPHQVEPNSLVSVAAHTTKAIRATVERSNHGQRLEVREGVQRVQDGVTVLLRAKGIEPAHKAAAERYLSDYMTGVEGVSQAQADRRGGGDIHTTMLARANAVTRVTTVQRTIGRAATLRLNMFVIEQLSFSSMAARLFAGNSDGRKRVQGQVVLVLDHLAEVYLDIDTERRPANGNPPKAGQLS